MLRPSLAKNIITEVRKFLDEDLIVVNVKGIIIASTDESRIGTFHEGAQISYHERSKIVITEKDQAILKGVKSGINLPIFFQEKIVGIIGITGDPKQVSPYGELLRKMTELLIKESYYSEQLERQYRTLEAFVFDWIQQKEWSISFKNQADLLGIDLFVDRQVILGHYYLTDSTIVPRSVWQDIIQSFTNESNDIFVRWGNERFVILLAGTKPKEQTLYFLKRIKKYLAKKYQLQTSFGVGQIVSSLDTSLSFEQAERSLAVAKKTNTIIFDDDLTLDMCLQDIKTETRLEFVNRTIGSILEDKELIDTLFSFIEHNLSLKNTADKLHVHINTLHYRFKKINEITNLNPRNFLDMTTLYLALLFLEDHLKSNQNNR